MPHAVKGDLYNYLYNADENRWILSPAYDLTYSSSQSGEHATTVNGEGRSPGTSDILHVARKAGIDAAYAKNRANEIKEAVTAMLGKYLY